MDFFLALCALCVLSPVFLILIAVTAIVMKGNPFFTQRRPGRIDPKTGKEKIFLLIKFRTMSNARDKDGKLLPDEVRLNRFGKFLRSTSLDELPELLNILKGDMSVVGPRPQLVRDMVFMSPEVRQRHSVRPGLSGLAQVSGRNNITWEKKFEYDLAYIQNITFRGDVKIVFQTISKVLSRRDVAREGSATDMDFGDWLMHHGKVDQAEYNQKQEEAKEWLRV